VVCEGLEVRTGMGDTEREEGWEMGAQLPAVHHSDQLMRGVMFSLLIPK
jgi:hypothetical protein